MIDIITNPLALIGRAALRFFYLVGKLISFTCKSVVCCFTPPFYLKQLLKQLVDIGYYSLPVVGLTTLFTGMVLALQSYVGFSRFAAENAIPTVVVLSITRELGPVMAGLMVAGRIGAYIAAEIGTMRVTEQIDALSTLSTNPYRYLIAPRIIAGTLMLPVLVLIGNVIGVFGGFLVSVYKLGFNPANYIFQTWQYLELHDVTSGLVKAAVFGFIIAVMGCFCGFNSKLGAQGVGRATTNAVVSASILIFVFNYLLTGIFFSGR
ncbi:MAG: ABC transporter permease [Alphaproteobacteria bacterium]|nr:ABC transporter permease [Alphaproteobacteria bacterium]MCL2505065.1 ABC transporter permease [Alphaproteobacteria bacterium]